MKTTDEKILEQVIQVINKALFVEKRQILHLESVSLYPSEVHLMLMIENELDTNATEIAKKLGLTKGAISQTLTRLEKKGIIVKTRDPYRKNELTLALTEFGREAYEQCLALKTSFMASHASYLANLRPGEKKAILNFLVHLEGAMESRNVS